VNPDKLRKARELFTAAMGKKPSDRETFLRSETQGDDELFEETLLLLDHDETEVIAEDDATQLLEPPSRTPKLLFDEAYLAGKKQIGNYRLIRRIGQGGMGMVYAACLVTEDFQRQVALKLVKPSLASSQILRRFRMERQLLASLDHPHIARLLDAGTTDEGAPYLVMEFVEGLPIDRFCESQNLTIHDRLRLFITVCDAVQYAHQNLIIHRDLKPSNILVSSEGSPKLLDFGIAKLIRPEDAPGEELKLTATDSRPMSPHYASPEQARGEPITTASDIYSLGVLLYELLTGQLPYEFKNRSPAGIEKTICETEPVPPSEVEITTPLSESPDKVRKRLRGDLDMIMLMAMRKEPSRRYSSVHQFAEDIRRHLIGQTVIAQRDTLGYRVSKFVRRHTAGVIAASLAILALITSTIVSVHFAQVATKEKQVAERRFRDTWSLAKFFITDFDNAIRTSQTEARRMLVSKGVENLRNLATETAGDQTLLRDVVAGYVAMGDVQGNPFGPNIGDVDGARASYAEAIRLAESNGGATNPDVINARFRLAELDVLNGNRKAALEGFRKILPTFHGADRIKLLIRIGFASSQVGQLHEAEKAYKEAMDVSRAEMEKHPNDNRAKQAYAQSAFFLGDTMTQLKNFDGAIETLKKAMAIYTQMGGFNSQSVDVRRFTWSCSTYLADAYAKKGSLKEAEALQRKNLAAMEALVLTDPNNAQFSRDRIVSMSRLADTLSQQPGRSEEARKLTIATLAALKPYVDAETPQGYFLQNYLWILQHTPFADLRRPNEMMAYSEKWLAQVGTSDPQALDALAQAQFWSGNVAKAIDLEEKAISQLPSEGNSELRSEFETNLRKFKSASAAK
jgi:eukaryotic-like serine/threonine-protein kinase